MKKDLEFLRIMPKPSSGFSLAAKQHGASGQFQVGYHYNFGKGVPQNYAEALKCYLLAAEQGDPDA